MCFADRGALMDSDGSLMDFSVLFPGETSDHRGGSRAHLHRSGTVSCGCGHEQQSLVLCSR